MDNVVLKKWLTTSDLDQIAVMGLDIRDDILDALLMALVESICRVAPRTAQVARREPYEHTRPTCPRGFALNRIEDLVDGQHSLLSIL
jgi:hypothetical protein